MSNDKNYCGECAWLDCKNQSSWNSSEYYCDKKCKYCKLTNKACYDFILDPATQKKSGSYTPSGCYITTIVCDVLGYPDDCEILTTLRNFRDNILKQDPQYLSLLIHYDVVGPLINNGIRCEKNNDVFCMGLLKYFLIPCVEEIKNNNTSEAVKMYQNMVYYLNDEFSLPTIVLPTSEEIDMENVGKGRILKHI